MSLLISISRTSVDKLLLDDFTYLLHSTKHFLLFFRSHDWHLFGATHRYGVVFLVSQLSSKWTPQTFGYFENNNVVFNLFFLLVGGFDAFSWDVHVMTSNVTHVTHLHHIAFVCNCGFAIVPQRERGFAGVLFSCISAGACLTKAFMLMLSYCIRLLQFEVNQCLSVTFLPQPLLASLACFRIEFCLLCHRFVFSSVWGNEAWFIDLLVCKYSETGYAVAFCGVSYGSQQSTLTAMKPV